MRGFVSKKVGFKNSSAVECGAHVFDIYIRPRSSATKIKHFTTYINIVKKSYIFFGRFDYSHRGNRRCLFVFDKSLADSRAQLGTIYKADKNIRFRRNGASLILYFIYKILLIYIIFNIEYFFETFL